MTNLIYTYIFLINISVSNFYSTMLNNVKRNIFFDMKRYKNIDVLRNKMKIRAILTAIKQN